jgi:hypothetical protein
MSEGKKNMELPLENQYLKNMVWINNQLSEIENEDK